MNYGEDLAYWYLRLNGFFPIANFVVHKTDGVEHRSDVDVLAIRLPHVYEPIGGQEGDWDHYLRDNLDLSRSLGIFCEVKTGDFEMARLFRVEQLAAAVSRTGLVPPARLGQVLEDLKGNAIASTQAGANLAKLFVSRNEVDGPFLNRTIIQVRAFLEERVRRYDFEKYASRMFFPSTLVQNLIDQVHHDFASGAA